jgi:microcystin-dependent protein
MSEHFLGEIQIFGFGFAPYQWAQCSGQIMPLSQNTALFSLLGTNFGGDGRTTFGLPNFSGSAACGVGPGPGLTERIIGETFGSETVTLLPTEIPQHSHAFNIYNQGVAAKRHGIPVAGDALSAPGTVTPFAAGTIPSGTFPAQMVQPTGGSQAHANQQPYLAMNFCIALQGTFPARP